jgi:hypothetical protein
LHWVTRQLRSLALPLPLKRFRLYCVLVGCARQKLHAAACHSFVVGFVGEPGSRTIPQVSPIDPAPPQQVSPVASSACKRERNARWGVLAHSGGG